MGGTGGHLQLLHVLTQHNNVWQQMEEAILHNDAVWKFTFALEGKHEFPTWPSMDTSHPLCVHASASSDHWGPKWLQGLQGTHWARIEPAKKECNYYKTNCTQQPCFKTKPQLQTKTQLQHNAAVPTRRQQIRTKTNDRHRSTIAKLTTLPPPPVHFPSNRKEGNLPG